ncbi:sialic acid-binding Ig-like lectin 14 isoform X6 [Gadus morhua]|uniref:sialic acid-binding Ig-like lectin 14 isoform X6 n=1 Tax=Gadus morhua TaxID=8049 RepID=UPI0011B47F70|nr:sialic acid-binding Ig-like lectin 14 isoform X6 [Gadus morhua]XP_030215693.1 sialic acid-binding Ig-like lectin 14 isoform X6 [Gadus morhua]
MTGSWRLFLLCSLLQGAGCNAAEFKTPMAASVTTLSGSCVTVPCSFTVDNTYKDKILPECGKLWFKTDTKVLMSSTTFRGNLTAYDCTTTFNNVHEDNGQYYFRIDCDGSDGFKYNFDKTPVTIQIKGLPDAPRLTPPKELVVEGTPVELGCSAPSYCDTHPPTVTWPPALGVSTQLQQNDTVTSTLTFNASHLHHGNNVSCTAVYYIPSGNKTVTSTRHQLSILYAPRNTSAVGSPCLPAREGGCLNLTCTSHANPAVSEFTWYRIHGEHILKIGTGSSLSIQLWNDNDVFFCEVRNDFGTEKSTVYKIDVQNQLPWIAATAVLAAGLLFATACAVRAWKMATRTRLGSDGLLNKAPPNQGNPQVFFRSGEDIYANIDTLMNTVGPREEPVGAGGEAAGLGEGAVGLGEGAVGLGEGAVGLGEGAVGLGEGAVGPREEAVTAAGSSALIQRDSEEAADPAADRQVEDCDVLYTTVNWKNKKKKKKGDLG